MRKILILLPVLLMMMAAFVAAECGTAYPDASCNKQIAWHIFPCTDNMQTDTRLVLNLTISACQPDFDWSKLWAFQENSWDALFKFGPTYADTGIFYTCKADQECPLGTSFAKGPGLLLFIANPSFNQPTCSSCNPAFRWDGGIFGIVTPNLEQQIKLNCEDVKYKVTFHMPTGGRVSTTYPTAWSDWVPSWQSHPMWKATDLSSYNFFTIGGYPDANITYDSLTDASIWTNDTSGIWQIKVDVYERHNASVQAYLINYSISPTGFAYGSCYSSSESPSWATSTDPFTRAFGSLGGGFTKGLIWGLLMVIVGAIIFFSAKNINQKFVFGMVGVVEILLLFIGTYLHIISWIFIMLIMIGIIVYVAFRFKEMIS